jgi:hypothetical protein
MIEPYRLPGRGKTVATRQDDDGGWAGDRPRAKSLAASCPRREDDGVIASKLFPAVSGAAAVRASRQQRGGGGRAVTQPTS